VISTEGYELNCLNAVNGNHSSIPHFAVIRCSAKTYIIAQETKKTWCGSVSESEFDEKMQESIFTFAIHTVPVFGSATITRAMMNGTPVIATPLGGSSDYLDDTGMYALRMTPPLLPLLSAPF
jgi:hypothetical protein